MIHTPGPWRYRKPHPSHHREFNEKAGCLYVETDRAYSTGPDCYQTLCEISVPMEHEEQEGNACLIAAAPELLQALEETAKNCPCLIGGSGQRYQQHVPHCKVRAAVRKAKGEL